MKSSTCAMLLCFLLLTTLCMNAQTENKVLMLQKKNRNKNAYYHIGEELTFYRHGDRRKIRARIYDFEDSAIVFKDYRVSLKEIAYLHIDEKTRWWIRYKPAQLLLISGTGYLGLNLINNQKADNATLIIGGSAIGTGLLLKLLIRDKIRIKGRTRLRILRL